MKTFIYRGERTYVETFIVKVDAETQDEADQMIEDGDYEEEGHSQEFVGDSDSLEFESMIVYDEDEDEEDDEHQELGGEGGDA